MKDVILYMPNRWRELTGVDEKFCWFLCGKRYYVNSTQSYVIEIPKGVRFYEPSSGHTYVITTSRKIKLRETCVPVSYLDLVLDDVDGYALMQECPKSIDNKKCIFCQEARFVFIDDALVISKKEAVCELVGFSKRQNSQIRKRIPLFPTCEQIDKSIIEFGCADTCKILYEHLTVYFTRSEARDLSLTDS